MAVPMRWCSILLLAWLLGCSAEPAADPAPNRPLTDENRLADETSGTGTSDDDEAPTTGDDHGRTTVEHAPLPANAILERSVIQLASDDDQVREAAELTLRSAGPEAIAYLLAGMHLESGEARFAVAYFLLEKFPSNDSRIGSALVAALTDDHEGTRGLALQAVRRMPQENLASALPRLAEMLEGDRDGAVRRAEAAQLIGKMESEARDVLPLLIHVAREDPAAKVRAACIYSISRIAAAAEALPLFQAALKDEDAAVRVVAVARLGRLAAAAGPAAPALTEMFDDEEEKVRRGAAEALARIGAESVQPLIDKLTDDDARTRQLALYTLGKLGGTAKPAIPAIQQRLTDDDQHVRELAEAVLRHIRRTP